MDATSIRKFCYLDRFKLIKICHKTIPLFITWLCLLSTKTIASETIGAGDRAINHQNLSPPTSTNNNPNQNKSDRVNGLKQITNVNQLRDEITNKCSLSSFNSIPANKNPDRLYKFQFWFEMLL